MFVNASVPWHALMTRHRGLLNVLLGTPAFLPPPYPGNVHARMAYTILPPRVSRAWFPRVRHVLDVAAALTMRSGQLGLLYSQRFQACSQLRPYTVFSDVQERLHNTP